MLDLELTYIICQQISLTIITKHQTPSLYDFENINW